MRIGLQGWYTDLVADGHGTVLLATPRTPNLIAVSTKDTTFADLITAGTASIKGERTVLDAVFDHLDTFMTGFPIVEP